MKRKKDTLSPEQQQAYNCLGDYQQMKKLGGKFHGEPTSGPWGTGVLLEDLYGNKIFMSQEF